MLLTGRRPRCGWREREPARWSSEGRREELVDQGQDDQEDEAGAEAPADQLLLDRQQRLVLGLLELAADIVLRHCKLAPLKDQLASGGLMPLKNSQEISRPTQITKPNRLTK